MKQLRIVFLCLTLVGCSKEPPAVNVRSDLFPDSNVPFEKAAAFLEDLTFVPPGQPLNRRDLAALSGIILQSHALALAAGERHLKVKKSWRVFRAVDLSLREKKAWQEFLRKNLTGESVEAEALANAIMENVR